MGAIQNSINGAIGAVAVAGRMIGNEKDSIICGFSVDGTFCNGTNG